MKNLIKNWIKEHRTISFIIGGAIGLPIAATIVFGLLGLLLIGLSFLFGKLIGTLVFVFMLFGGVIGYFISTTKEKEHGDYY